MSRKKRRKQTPVPPPTVKPTRKWVYPAIAGLAAAGVAVSGYLTFLAYSGMRAAGCTEGSGCDIVRASSYSHIFGIPVALFGVLGFIAVLAVALWPAADKRKRLALLLMALAGFAFAGYLTFIELAVVRAVCPYCVVSALLMTGVLVVLLMQKPVAPGISGKRLVTESALVVVVVLAGSALAPRSFAGEQAASDYQTKLAQHLTSKGAVVYGAYWCPHCTDQKELFGKAFAYINYVECDPKGQNANSRLCQEKGVKLYPSWDINGKRYEGVLSLSQLAAMTGFAP